MHLSEERFIEVLQSNQGIIRKVANSYCKNVDDRDDLIQEITIQLWHAWSKYNPNFKLSTWMYRISLNVAISFYRKTYRRTALNEKIQNDPMYLNQEEDGELSEQVRELYQYIGELDELNKALILLYLDKCSHDEIAETLGLSKTNVATKISRIKQQLKQKFQAKKTNDGLAEFTTRLG